PGESDSGIFGGNSNWRGPVWFPVNYLLLEALERYHYYYGNSLKVECPTGSGRMLTMLEVAEELCVRLSNLFLRDAEGRRPCHGDDSRYINDPHFRDLLLFYEYFHGDNGRGVGASHQTGWTGLITRILAFRPLIRTGRTADAVRAARFAMKPTQDVVRPTSPQ
ncbi:MAG: MGH1-like glycoside hydrolase domain-containing protein, partial [Tepidisphaeraceae bacterium]